LTTLGFDRHIRRAVLRLSGSRFVILPPVVLLALLDEMLQLGRHWYVLAHGKVPMWQLVFINIARLAR
jgi:hypothetical protein